MRIINVIEIKFGVLENIISFPILEEQLSDEVVSNAEAEYLKRCREHGADEEEFDDDFMLNEAYFDNGLGYEVMISWSEVVI